MAAHLSHSDPKKRLELRIQSLHRTALHIRICCDSHAALVHDAYIDFRGKSQHPSHHRLPSLIAGRTRVHIAGQTTGQCQTAEPCRYSVQRVIDMQIDRSANGVEAASQLNACKEGDRRTFAQTAFGYI